MFPYFLASHTQYEEQIFESIQLEHIGLSHLASIDSGVECQGGIERNVGLRDAHLQIVNQVGKCRVAKETLASIDGMLEAADSLIYIILHLVDG